MRLRHLESHCRSSVFIFILHPTVGLPATSQRLGLRTLISAALGRHQRLTLATLRLSRIGQGVDPFYVVCEGIWVAHADIN